MLILGVDPGTATTGYGFIRTADEKVCVVDYELIETEANGYPPKRYDVIYRSILALIHKHKPDVMAIEKVFFASNAKTAIRVGQAQGVMLLAAAHSGIEVVEYAPGTIKKMISGNGRANKKDMQKAVIEILGPAVYGKPGRKTHFDNAADALAIALCHAYKMNFVKPILDISG